MKHINSHCFLAPTFALAAALGLSGCGGDASSLDSDEIAGDVGQSSAELSLGECQSAHADQTYSGTAFHVFTPTKYSNADCAKHFVLRGVDYRSPEDLFYDFRFADPWARNESQCRGFKIEVIESTFTSAFDLGTTRGKIVVSSQWRADWGVCLLPEILLRYATGDWVAYGEDSNKNMQNMIAWGSIAAPPANKPVALKFAVTAQTGGGTTQPLEMFGPL